MPDQVRDVPKPQPVSTDNTSENQGLNAGSSNFDYLESMKEMGKTAWKAASDFVNNPEVQAAAGAIAQNPEVQKMLLGFVLDTTAQDSGGAGSEGEGAGSKGAEEKEKPVEKIKIQTEYPMSSPSSYNPAFEAFSQLDPTPGDGGLTQNDLQQLGSDAHLEDSAQSLASSWSRKETFDKVASLDGDSSSISDQDMKALFDKKDRELFHSLITAAKNEEQERGLRERIGLPRTATHEEYMKELEKRGFSKYADELLASIQSSLTDETLASEERMQATLQAAYKAGIPLETLAQVINAKADPDWKVEMDVRTRPPIPGDTSYPNGWTQADLHVGDHSGFPFEINPAGELIPGRYRGF